MYGSCPRGHREARRLLEQHRGASDALVAALMERETLGEQEILDVTGLPCAPVLRDRDSGAGTPAKERESEPHSG